MKSLTYILWANQSPSVLVRLGLQRDRVMLVREMGDDDGGDQVDTGATIDSIEIAEFQSHEALKASFSG